jgi:HEAT repeat protein
MSFTGKRPSVTGINDDELTSMVLDYMEKGFLDNIIDMFRHDESLFPLIIDMVKDERFRVRLGATALVEEFAEANRDPLVRLVPQLGSLLTDPNPTIRGDSANLLGIIGDADALPFLSAAVHDDNSDVRHIVQEAIEEVIAPRNAC